jgi:cell division protein ZapA (FtsZ GTPase activity inhibitor)
VNIMKRIDEKKKDRFNFLSKLYEKKTSRYSNSRTADICDELGLSQNECDLVVQYLVGEDLVRSMDDASELIYITHSGVVEIEQLLSEPEKPTEHFLPVVNVTNVWGNMTNSQVMQSSTGSSQNLAITQEQTDALREFIKIFNEKLEDIRFESAEDKQEAIADVTTIKAQLESPKPKREIIKSAGNTLKGVLEKAAAIELVEYLKDLF